MRFTSFLFGTGLALSVNGAILARETIAEVPSKINSAIVDINKAGLALTKEITAWNGEAFTSTPIFVAASQLVVANILGTHAANTSKTLTAEQTTFIAKVPLPAWVKVYTDLFTAVQTAKPKWAKLYQTPLVYGELVAVQKATSHFLDAVVAKLPDAASVKAVSEAVTPVVKSIKKVVGEYQPQEDDKDEEQN